jgi:hypothetical protein
MTFAMSAMAGQPQEEGAPSRRACDKGAFMTKHLKRRKSLPRRAQGCLFRRKDIFRAFTKIDATQDDDLRAVFEKHQRETECQIERLKARGIVSVATARDFNNGNFSVCECSYAAG